jgi:hypothetical protein
MASTSSTSVRPPTREPRTEADGIRLNGNWVLNQVTIRPCAIVAMMRGYRCPFWQSFPTTDRLRPRPVVPVPSSGVRLWRDHDARSRPITRSQHTRIAGLYRDFRTPTIGGGMDRAADGDSLNASYQDQSAPSGSCDRVDHGFSIRGRTHRHRQTARWRFRDRSHRQAAHRGRATPGLAGLGEPSAMPRDWDLGCGRPSHARAGSPRLPDFRRTG